MLTYVFENNGIPLYEQVYAAIKNDILQGNLVSGDKLPSKRTFAAHNGISTITIQNAYDQLISEGYIYTIPKKGYYVSTIENMPSKSVATSVSFDIKTPEIPVSYPMDVSSNGMHPQNFPFSIWARLLREIISTRHQELMEVSPTGGIYALKKAIASYLHSFRGMLVDPNQIIIGAGTEYLYGMLIQLLGFDKNYCIENPGYKKLLQVYQQYHVTCSFASMDELGISTTALKKTNAQVAHISPNHHFPTGITMPASRRYEVLAWANEKEDRYIIEDDYDSEFRSNGKPIPTLFSIDACEKVIYMNTFSKSLTPTIRISYMILPPHLANTFYEKFSHCSCTVSNFEQYTLAAFIEKGYFEKHINRMRLYYTRQRKKLISILENSSLKNFCHIIENDSGLHFLIQLQTSLEDRDVKMRLQKKGIHMHALSEYYLTQKIDKKHYFIINYSNIDETAFADTCESIYQAIVETS